MDNLAESMHKLLIAHKELKNVVRIQDCGLLLTTGEFGVMATIIGAASNGDRQVNPVDVGVSMKKLSFDRNCTPAMITKLINCLEQKEFVSRHSNAQDRRGVRVCITEKGLNVWEHDHKCYHELFDGIAAEMGEDKIKMLYELTYEFLSAGKKVAGDMANREKEKSNG